MPGFLLQSIFLCYVLLNQKMCMKQLLQKFPFISVKKDLQRFSWINLCMLFSSMLTILSSMITVILVVNEKEFETIDRKISSEIAV